MWLNHPNAVRLGRNNHAINPFANLTSYYRLEENGTAPQDSVGTRHLNTTFGTLTRIVGKHNYGVQIATGSEATKTTGFANTAAHSVSAWARFAGSEPEANNSIFGSSIGAKVVYVSRSGLAFGINYNGSFNAGANRSVDTWYHLVYVFDGASSNKLYVNSVIDVSVTGDATGVGADFFIASNFAPAGQPNLLDEIGWFSAAIPEAQIFSLYNSGYGIFY